ncbi:hypothetical protein GN244_ATG09935, partial [Phytophthora infestans]
MGTRTRDAPLPTRLAPKYPRRKGGNGNSKSSQPTASEQRTAPPPQEAPQQEAPPPSPSSSTASTPTEDQIISNWKLFNDLENREGGRSVGAVTFLGCTRELHPRSGRRQAKPTEPHPVSQQDMGNIDIANMYVQGRRELDEVITHSAI